MSEKGAVEQALRTENKPTFVIYGTLVIIANIASISVPGVGVFFG